MDFWDSSWERVEGDRITEYINTFDMGTDAIVTGMIFHPYSREEIGEMIPAGVRCEIADKDGELTVLLQKNDPQKR